MSLYPILKLELRETLRQRLTWLVLGMLFAAMLIGGAVGSARVQAERETLDRVTAEASESVAASKATRTRYAQPAPYKVAQFRDPSDTYGYMFNFLTRFTTRAPAPLAALTAGQSDLQPSFIRVNFTNVFPDSAYELKSPRMLALGAFDLGFVLVYLVPLALIALGGTRLAGEQDTGILRMIAAQPVAPTTVAIAKFGALALISVPVVALGTLLALLVTGGVAAGISAGSLLLLLLLVALYVLFWVAACALTASLWKGEVGALAALVLGWAATTVLLPALAALVLDLALPAPSRLAYVDASRATADRLAADKSAPARWLASRPDLARLNPAAANSPEVGRLAAQALTRAALLPQREAFETHAARVEAASTALRLVSPALMLDGALQRLAGTDAQRQRLFVAEADAEREVLRRWFEPRVVTDIGKPPICAACPGRLTFDAYDELPTFQPVSAHPRLGAIGLAALYLATVTAAVAFIARRRLASWPL